MVVTSFSRPAQDDLARAQATIGARRDDSHVPVVPRRWVRVAVSPVQMIAMRMERKRLARLRRSVGMPFVDDKKPGAGPGLVVVLCALGVLSCLLLGWALAGSL